jgi:hypothetical protein
MLKTTSQCKDLIFIGLVFFILAACQKDNESSNVNNDIIGNWTISSSTINATVNDIPILQYFTDELEMDQSMAEEMASEYITPVSGTIEIKNDGTYVSITNGESDNGTWKLSSDNKKLTLDAGTEYETIMDVVSLTSSKLELSYSETMVVDFDFNGISETIIMEGEITCTK